MQLLFRVGLGHATCYLEFVEGMLLVIFKGGGGLRNIIKYPEKIDGTGV